MIIFNNLYASLIKKDTPELKKVSIKYWLNTDKIIQRQLLANQAPANRQVSK